MNEVRVGVIGCGGMGQSHMGIFKDLPRLKFTAASDSMSANLDKVVTTYGVKGFSDGHELIKSGLCDAIIIATPHYFHPEYAVAALQQGLHVLTEKPVSVNASAARRVNDAAAKRPDLKYAAMFQMRTVSRWKKVHQIVASGQLGEMRRFHWTATGWFRTQAYYGSGSWRATWAGEGGGILANQCPHNLDLVYWITGMPKRIHAHLKLGRYHDIEVEDDVIAYFEYPNGATGLFVTSTGEFPGSDYFEIAGDRGKLTFTHDGKIDLTLTDGSIAEFCKTSPGAWSSPTSSRMTIEPPAGGGGHKDVWLNFIAAILDGTPLVTPGVEGLHSVEISNAMILSGLTGKTVDLPTNHAEFDDLLRGLIRKSKKSTTLPPGL
ncbi:MAG: Gfo/Idh/MocA family oxidoreductase [Planctomycetes bacterium]|nr:Gfo/Idh/MocA family oxidoreductase [Planctomycetota bacterium]